MMNEDEERRALIHEFYQTYLRIRKSRDIREHSHFDIYGNHTITIWEYAGEQRGKCICRAKEETEIECYRRAIEELKNYEQKEGIRHGKRAG